MRLAATQNASAIQLARKRAETELFLAKEALELQAQALARMVAQMRATLEATTDAILVVDQSGRVTHHNANFARIWGLPPELLASGDLEALRGGMLAQVADRAAFSARIDAIYQQMSGETFDEITLADGRLVERVSRLQMIGGEAVGRVWSFRDVTAYRHAEAAAREEAQVLELLNRTGATLAARMDLEQIVQSVTDATTEVTGARFGAFFYTTKDENGGAFTLYTLSGAPREAFEKFGHPRATALFGPTFNGEGPIRIDDVLKDPRYGQWNPHRGMPPGHLPVRSYLAMPVVLRSGEVIGGLFFGHPEPGVFTARAERIVIGIAAQAAVAIDNERMYQAARLAAVERERLLESERAARGNAERLSDIKDDFLATLSHELRTPLSAILGWSQLLRRGVKTPEDLSRGLETIERNARVQTKLIDDLLDMSRIASGKVRLDIQQVEPTSVIEAAIETVLPAASAKGIRIERMLDPLAAPISGDPGRLQQIVWNLLSNAIKFTPKEGKVQVTLERVNSHIEINVADTGIGIEAGFLPHVFERFQQADASTTRKYGGLGLGLSIVKNLVELHGGSVRARSPGPGLGATFSVHLPVTVVRRPDIAAGRRHPATPTEASGFAVIDLGGLRIVAVDDEPDARDLVKRILEECGAEVYAAADAAGALALIEAQRPDVLVSDIGMPGVDGYELLRQVRALNEECGGKVPAVALTAFARSEDRIRALTSGFMMHVAKPVDPSELVATVASVAGRAMK